MTPTATRIVAPPIPQPADTITLSMTPAHAEALLAVFSHIGGDPTASRRGLMDELQNALRDLGGLREYDEDINSYSRGSIYFIG